MASKKQIKKLTQGKGGLLLVALLASVVLNFYLYEKSNTITYTEPESVKNMGGKYKEFLKTMPEDAAQTALVDWLKKDPLVLGSQRYSENNVAGVSFDYCTGSRGAGHNSWDNLK